MEFIAIAALAVSSQVTDVTVYNDRAQVVRTATVELGQRIQWFRTLSPSEEWEIPFSFHVQAPEDKPIEGL